MVEMEGLQDCDQQTGVKSRTRERKRRQMSLVDVLRIRVFPQCEGASPDGQFLLNLASLQDVNEVFQVVEVLGPGQPATPSSDHLH